jgi:hypothetical protein
VKKQKINCERIIALKPCQSMSSHNHSSPRNERQQKSSFCEEKGKHIYLFNGTLAFSLFGLPANCSRMDWSADKCFQWIVAIVGLKMVER